jgi:peroxiredoxin
MQTATHLTLIAFQALILISLWTLLYQVVKQQGRLLLRLDDLDRRLSDAGLGAGPEETAGPVGLDVGTSVSMSRLPDLEGRLVSLDDYPGRRIILVHWNPDCVFCELLAPELARLQADLRTKSVQLVLASSEDAEANRKLAREQGLTCPIVLMPEDAHLEGGPFTNLGTPVAYLLDEQQRVAQPVAVGGEAILDLAQGIIGKRAKRSRLVGERPLSQSRIERNGLKAGTAAPVFRLPGLDGGTVDLEDYRGRKVLLVFSDPHCGPCEELAPHLVRIHRQHRDNGLVVLMVTRGDLEENRSKADRHGFEFPVAIQDRWNLSKEYGIFAMPLAFLIDEEGMIVKDVALGVAEIRALVPKEVAALRT